MLVRPAFKFAANKFLRPSSLGRTVQSTFLQFSTVTDINRSTVPLIQNIRSAWPERRPSEEAVETIPVRTVADSDLSFAITARFDKGHAILYPHLDHHPGDCKVIMKVIFGTKEIN